MCVCGSLGVCVYVGLSVSVCVGLAVCMPVQKLQRHSAIDVECFSVDKVSLGVCTLSAGVTTRA